ncbi:MAG: tRNA (guanosine(37)-N1)-methyltransferase TrmD [Victivallaceae bacterium]|nr:tRNA (guanosine(37)-N1)-methyltransferase TrmD [Victivallaceae bacterium]NLK83700.1 tRNA (guanosine(37)-N1)-methyltransferase TrmD [Lentisphaerota bacterium]MDD3115998.1 tRNA (guanosine(37)-N1)-methyltransferase TrmD [Victivallaceae bacterium]MDD3703838.1 tRNA (guanosine(37)-N1)-methyltransferase TrmD [Victivallaceae bacterium]MDD4318173.1 tRNA (guanosine(37)-N1)-methyltransferase TrmD [Victivallaceae bacterium]
MRFDIITLFPDIFFGPLNESIIGRARKNGLVEINAVNLRDFAHDERGTVDDSPYGGGPGMLMKPEPIFEAVESLRRANSLVLMTSPRGKRFDQPTARKLSGVEHIIMICGHYEGVDERVRSELVDIEISIGDYVLTSGNLAAMVICDAVIRLLPGVLGCDESSFDESFSSNLLEYPQYTRPAEYRGMKVPEVLLSGNHAEIAAWRKGKAFELTSQLRPDLLDKDTN